MDREKKQVLTVSTIRNANVINILQSILRDKQKTRSELASENNISVMTVKHIVDDLMAAGILVKKTGIHAEVGRKPEALAISAEYGNIVCINMTAETEISYIIYDIYETMLERDTIVFDKTICYRENLEQAFVTIAKRLQTIGTTTVGLALFAPSAYYEAEDLVNYDLIPALKDLHIKALATEIFGIENSLVLHDVFPAAMSEYEASQPKAESQFYFYCGHGIGGFFIHKEVAVMGNELMAGEVGKMILPVGQNQFDTFENVASIAAILSKLSQEETFDAVLERYEKGEHIKVIEDALDVITRVLYNLLWVYNPSTLVIDSCYQKYAALIIQRLEGFLQEMQNDAIPMNVAIRPAVYDEYHMMKGCFHMARTAWIEEKAIFRKASE